MQECDGTQFCSSTGTLFGKKNSGTGSCTYLRYQFFPVPKFSSTGCGSREFFVTGSKFFWSWYRYFFWTKFYWCQFWYFFQYNFFRYHLKTQKILGTGMSHFGHRQNNPAYLFFLYEMFLLCFTFLINQHLWRFQNQSVSISIIVPLLSQCQKFP